MKSIERIVLFYFGFVLLNGHVIVSMHHRDYADIWRYPGFGFMSVSIKKHKAFCYVPTKPLGEFSHADMHMIYETERRVDPNEITDMVP